MRGICLRIAAGVVVASVAGWAVVAILGPRLAGRLKEGFPAPMIHGALRVVAASIETAPRNEWPMHLETARRHLGMPLAIIPSTSLPLPVGPRFWSGLPAVVSTPGGRPSIYLPLRSGAEVLVAGPLPPPPLEPLVSAAVVFALAVTITASAAVGIPLARRLRRLRRAVAELGGGNLAVRLDPKEGELSELATCINRMASQLQRRFDEREALLQAVSHEMGTPLSRIRFTIELMHEAAVDLNQNKRLRAITADVDELDSLSSELLSWMATAAAEPRRQAFAIAPVLESLVELESQRRATPAHVELRVPSDLTVVADQRQFQRAIENLLRNALRYAQHLIVLHGESDGNHVVVEVRDDGPGICSDQRHRVLDPFVRLEAGQSAAHCGLGLGLAIVRRVVEAHGGSVVVSEAPEGGTQVRTRWPCSAASSRTLTARS